MDNFNKLSNSFRQQLIEIEENRLRPRQYNKKSIQFFEVVSHLAPVAGGSSDYGGSLPLRICSQSPNIQVSASSLWRKGKWYHPSNKPCFNELVPEKEISNLLKDSQLLGFDLREKL